MKFLTLGWEDCPFHCFGVETFCPMCHNQSKKTRHKVEKVKKRLMKDKPLVEMIVKTFKEMKKDENISKV